MSIAARIDHWLWVRIASCACGAAITSVVVVGCSGTEGWCHSDRMVIGFFVDGALVGDAWVRFGPTTPDGLPPMELPVLIHGPLRIFGFTPSLQELWVDVWLPAPAGGLADPARVVIPPPYATHCTLTTIVWHADLVTGVRQRIPVEDLYGSGQEDIITRWLTEEEVRAAGGRIYPAGE